MMFVISEGLVGLAAAVRQGWRFTSAGRSLSLGNGRSADSGPFSGPRQSSGCVRRTVNFDTGVETYIRVGVVDFELLFSALDQAREAGEPVARLQFIDAFAEAGTVSLANVDSHDQTIGCNRFAGVIERSHNGRQRVEGETQLRALGVGRGLNVSDYSGELGSRSHYDHAVHNHGRDDHGSEFLWRSYFASDLVEQPNGDFRSFGDSGRIRC